MTRRIQLARSHNSIQDIDHYLLPAEAYVNLDTGELYIGLDDGRIAYFEPDSILHEADPDADHDWVES